MESDRMGHLLGAVTQEKLDQQRGVVQNEKRQGDNQPYGIVDYEAQDALFPVGHPYRHSTIGSMRSEEHTSELQSLMRISYAVFCLKKKKNNIERQHIPTSEHADLKNNNITK